MKTCLSCGVMFESRGRFCNSCRNHRWKDKSENFFIVRIGVVKRRAEASGTAFNLTPEHLESIWTGICPISGLTLKKNSEAQVDKIDPCLGYTIGNVCWLHKRFNRLKSNMTFEDAQLLYHWFLEQKEQNHASGKAEESLGMHS